LLNISIAPTIIVTSSDIKSKDIEFIKVSEENNKLNLKELLKKLGEKGIMSILVEGGPQLHASFIENNLFQELFIYRSGYILGKNSYNWNENIISQSLKESKKLEIKSIEILDKDILEIYKNNGTIV